LKTTKLLAALALIVPAMAHGQGFYVGLDVGEARSDAKTSENVLSATTARWSGSSTALRLRGGFQIGRFFALEAAYVDFGEIESHFDPDDCPNGAPGTCPLDVRTSSSGILFSAVGVLPIGEHWYLDARLGWGKIDFELEELGGGGLEADEENTAFNYGIGGGYRFNEHWGVVLDYSEYNQEDFLDSALDGDFGVYNLGETSVTSLGVSYRW